MVEYIRLNEIKEIAAHFYVERKKEAREKKTDKQRVAQTTTIQNVTNELNAEKMSHK